MVVLVLFGERSDMPDKHTPLSGPSGASTARTGDAWVVTLSSRVEVVTGRVIGSVCLTTAHV